MSDLQTDNVIRLSISLYPEQYELLKRFARESGLENISAALRLIINEWARKREEAEQRQAGAATR